MTLTPDFVAARAGSLPADVTSFVGRRQERGDVRSALAQGRLLTVTGFGGIGKSRLATNVASGLGRAFTDGVVYVELGSITDPDWVAEHVALAAGLQGRAPRAAVTSLVEYLGGRHLLLVLDSSEHVVDRVALVVDVILRTCPKVKVLATSREPLRVDGEAVYAVAPLGTPSDSDEDAAESLVLFADRARAVASAFEVDDGNREHVRAICRKLEGIPLAIELAASRLGAMTPAELDRQITDRWELLTRGSRVAPRRHQTIQACIEWSFDLCSEAERDVWARASVFADGFEVDALDFLCDDRHSTFEVLDALHLLVEKSIVTAESIGETTRFRMLPPIRCRGLRRLDENDELTGVRRLHRDWCVEIARRANAEWVGPRQLYWLGRVRREAGNLRMALEFCASQPEEAERGMEIVGSLAEFAICEGLFRQGRHWADELLALSPQPSASRAMAVRAACWLGAFQGDLPRARALLTEDAELAGALGGRWQVLHRQTAGLVAMLSATSRQPRRSTARR